MLARVKAITLAATENQDIPFERVVDIVKPERSLAHGPLFAVMFAWQNAERGEWQLPGLSLSRLRVPHLISQLDLTLNLGEIDGQISGGLEYSTALFDETTALRYVEYLRRFLSEMLGDETQTIGQISILGDAERHRLLVEWNQTDTLLPTSGCLHNMVESRALQAPNATAIVCRDQCMTYGELSAASNQIARYLRISGVGAEKRVAIYMERGTLAIVALLAVLKAGGVYVPLDP
ncbi:MAG: AMP-binding protein, partial [Vulcanimicrobiaceae bacterium]